MGVVSFSAATPMVGAAIVFVTLVSVGFMRAMFKGV
jgi:hypothetical protein